MDSVDGNYSTFSVHKGFYFQDILSTYCMSSLEVSHQPQQHDTWEDESQRCNYPTVTAHGDSLIHHDCYTVYYL